jgi:hypothetical protein
LAILGFSFRSPKNSDYLDAILNRRNYKEYYKKEGGRRNYKKEGGVSFQVWG